mgnify:CR=1 FL=1
MLREYRANPVSRRREKFIDQVAGQKRHVASDEQHPRMLGRAERGGDAAERTQAGLQIGGDDSRLGAGVRHRRAGVAQQRAAPEPDAAFVAAHPLSFATGENDCVGSAAAGDGVGLGLAISSGIVNDLGGRLTARNASGGGAVFEVQLPILEEGMAAAE